MERIRSVDTLRVLAILAVIALHTARYQGPGAVGVRFDASTFLNVLERFAVPLFFIFSGYFWARPCRQPHDYLERGLRLCRRLLLLYVAWALVYLAVARLGGLWDEGAAATWQRLLQAWQARRVGLASIFLEGGTVHLWFLSALACAAAPAGLLLARGMRRSLLLLAVALYAVGLAGKAYAPTPLGFQAPFNLRDGPFFSLLFFVTGTELQRRRLPRAPWPGLALALAGLALQVLEVAWLHTRWGAGLVQDYVLATWLYGLGMGLLALSDAPLLRRPALAAVGPLVLGIYVSHYLFVELLRPLDEAWHGSAAWRLAYIALVFAGGLGLTWLLARFGSTRRLVM